RTLRCAAAMRFSARRSAEGNFRGQAADFMSGGLASRGGYENFAVCCGNAVFGAEECRGKFSRTGS
ncbi:MAG: hypothetical protein NC401_09215, partial [Ruminococcus sp.]|nr:hypothetical protein [Ruminococcus sp.]